MLRKPEDYLIVALHVADLNTGIEIFEQLNGVVRQFKVGQRAISRGFGHDLTDYITHNGGKVFLDPKYSDVPEEIAESMKGLNETLTEEVWMISVHANSGPESIRAAVDNRGSTEIFVVTVLTSIGDEVSEAIYTRDVEEEVLDLAELALQEDIQGVICSPLEVESVKSLMGRLGKNLPVLCPGVGLGSAKKPGHKRSASVREAIANGADYVVIGSDIVDSFDRIVDTYMALEEIEEALVERDRVGSSR